MTTEPNTVSQALDAAFRATPLHVALGAELVRQPGGVCVRAAVDETFARAQGLDSMHGGAIATLLDTAMTYAIVVETHKAWSTVDIRVDYLRPTSLGEVTVSATVLQAGSTIGRVEAVLSDPSGRATARATATFATLERRSGDREPRER